MGELLRRRRDRHLGLTRGHLAAGAVLVFAVALTGFFLGHRLGRGEAAVALADAALEPSDADLLDLLARVEAAADPSGGVEDLTFPEALFRERQPEVLPPPESSEGAVAPTGVSVTAEPPERPEPVASLDALPAPGGAWGLELTRMTDPGDITALVEALKASGLRPWVSEAAGDGFRTVVVGAYASEREAMMGLARAMGSHELLDRARPVETR